MTISLRRPRLDVPSPEETAPISWPCPNLSPHVRPPEGNAVELSWQTRAPGDVRRVLKYTCACRSTVYELCSLGGRVLVRRTVRHLRTTDYAGPWGIDDGDRWWIRLISGRAM